MKLKETYLNDGECVCELTLFIDNMKPQASEFVSSRRKRRGWSYVYDPFYEISRGFDGETGINYVLFSKAEPKETVSLALRAPGSTIGHIKINKEMVILDIKFYENVVLNLKGREDEVKHFIGRTIDVERFISQESFEIELAKMKEKINN